jgi:hypothetical protein
LSKKEGRAKLHTLKRQCKSRISCPLGEEKRVRKFAHPLEKKTAKKDGKSSYITKPHLIYLGPYLRVHGDTYSGSNLSLEVET